MPVLRPMRQSAGTSQATKIWDRPKKNWNATAKADAKPATEALPDIEGGADAGKSNGNAGEHGTNGYKENLSEKISEKKREPDQDRPVGNVYEAIERIKNCKTVEGAEKSMSTSVFKYKFSMNDRRRMKEAVDYHISILKKGG